MYDKLIKGHSKGHCPKSDLSSCEDSEAGIMKITNGTSEILISLKGLIMISLMVKLNEIGI